VKLSGPHCSGWYESHIISTIAMMVTIERIPTAIALEMKFYEAHWPNLYLTNYGQKIVQE
jgi:uncharacterized membrane protein YccF (DUF307 family)